MKFWRSIVDTYQGGASKRFAFFAVVLGALLVGALVFVFAVLPSLAVSGDGLSTDKRLQRESDARTAGLQALAGLVVAIGGSFTAFSVLSNREGQLDERFARALELLVSEDPYVAKGAVYSLERIAVQSGFDRPAAIDVLAGFIKSRAPEDSVRDSPDPPSASQEALDALNVLGRLKGMSRSPSPDLENTYWKKSPLGSKDMSGMLLARSQFQMANLNRANLSKADLTEAKLSNASLFEVDFREAKLREADLNGAVLLGARFENATLIAADLSQAMLGAANDFSGANLLEASLRDALIYDVDFSDAYLNGVDARGARYSKDARFPDGFDPGEEGMVLLPPSNANGEF